MYMYSCGAGVNAMHVAIFSFVLICRIGPCKSWAARAINIYTTRWTSPVPTHTPSKENAKPVNHKSHGN